MKSKKLAVFDVDGTLLDTKEGILSAVKFTINRFGLPPVDDGIISSFIGPPIQDSFNRVYGLEGPILQEIATVFRNRYSARDLLKARVYEGVYDVFEELKRSGIMTAVATYKRDDYANKIVRYFGFGRYTDIIYGADHENKLKKCDIIKKCIDASAVSDKAEVVMIGDSDNDAVGAARMGIEFIGVTYGYGFKSAEDCRKFANIGVASKPAQILEYIK